MDPVTIGLIIGGLFAASRIKRGTTPRRPITPRRIIPEPTSLGVPPHVFGGRELRPPVTHRRVSKERTLERSREGGAREDEEEKEIKITLRSEREQQALASSAAPDVVGIAASRASSPIYTRPTYTGVPLPGGGISAPKRTGGISSVFGTRR